VRLVYIVTRSDRIGGALVHVRDLALAMQQAGHEVTVLAGGTGCFTDQLRDRGIPYVTLRHLSRDISVVADACALFELRSVLKRLRPHLVSTHQSKAGWLGRLAARSLGIPVVFTAHGWSFTDGVPEGAATIHRWAERVAAPLADRIITVSDFDRALALRQRVATDHKLVSVHNGMPDVSPALRAAPERCPPRLIMVARFEAQKDHRTLLRALGALAHLDWSLELIGDGPLLPEARVLARTVGIADRVRFLGARDDVAQRLARAQLFLLITHWEGFPRSILEAMRAGLPVVASRAGGAAESVLDGETGVVVPPDNEAALRQALEPLLANAALRERLGAAGRQRYEASFTFDHMLDKTVAVYEAVLPARRVDVPQPFVIADRRPATAIGSSGP
jgi:glycosyltransferase involved in cell wall biosynthesis